MRSPDSCLIPRRGGVHGFDLRLVARRISIFQITERHLVSGSGSPRFLYNTHPAIVSVVPSLSGMSSGSVRSKIIDHHTAVLSSVVIIIRIPYSSSSSEFIYDLAQRFLRARLRSYPPAGLLKLIDQPDRHNVRNGCAELSQQCLDAATSLRLRTQGRPAQLHDRLIGISFGDEKR